MNGNSTISRLGRALTVILLFCGSGGRSEAQALSETDVAKQAAKADVSPRGIVQGTEPSLTLESGKEGTFLTGKIGFNRDILNNKLLSIVTFQAPFDIEEEVGFLNLDGLSGGTAATLKLTLEHAEILRRPDGTVDSEFLNPICDEINEEVAKNLEKQHAPVTECTETGIQASSIVDVEYTKKKNEALWVMCQEINKKRGIDLLAPPGEDRSGIPGYGGTCSKAEIIAAKTKELAALKLEELTKACDEFNKKRPAGQTINCSAADLAQATFDDEVAAKNREALIAACQEKLVVPDAALFRTGNTVSNTCSLSSLLDYAFTSRRPGYWYRETLEAFPVRLWYWTIEGTRTDQTFKYFDPAANFAAKSNGSDSTRYEGSLSLFYQGWFYSVGLGQQELFSASPSEEVCFPRESSPGVLNCVKGALAGPTKEDLTFARGEIRTFLRPNVGATLRGIYNMDAAEWEIHTIFHFLRNPQAGLNGGIDLQYNTAAINKTTPNPEGDHFTARLFIGSKFELPFLPGQE